jgi:hypothetical protein
MTPSMATAAGASEAAKETSRPDPIKRLFYRIRSHT